MLDFNSVLISVTGVMTGISAYLAKSWKESAEEELKELRKDVQEIAIDVASLRGKLGAG